MKDLSLELYQILLDFKEAAENIRDHIIITDVDGIIIYVNPAAEKITGFSYSQMIGTKAGKLWGGLMKEEFYKNMWKIIKDEKRTFRGRIRNRRADGVIYTAEIVIDPILDKDGEVVYFMAREKPLSDKSKNNSS